PASGMYAAYGGGDLRDLLAHLVLPAVTLAAASVTIIARLTRATMLETLGQDYIRTARAKGVVERAVVLRHGLKNALIPIVTVVVRVADGGGADATELGAEGRLTRSLARVARGNRLAVLAALGLLAAATLALVAPWLPLLDPDAVDTVERLRQPLTPGHALGTDEFGRDLLARLVWGARVSLLAG